jgi:hypothetical protein
MKMKIVFFVLLFASIMAMVGTVANAEGLVNYYKVAEVRADPDGKGAVYFYTTNPVGGSQPACATYRYGLAFDMNTTGGKAIYLLVLAAKMADKPIYAKGTNACAIYGGTFEDWRWGKMGD